MIVLVSAILMVPAMVWAQGEVMQQYNNGSINWSVFHSLSEPCAGTSNNQHALMISSTDSIHSNHVTRGVRPVNVDGSNNEKLLSA